MGADVSTGWSAMLVALARVGLETWAALAVLTLTALVGGGVRIYSERQRTTRYRLALQDVPPKNRADVVRALERLPEGTVHRSPRRRRGGH